MVLILCFIVMPYTDATISINSDNADLVTEGDMSTMLCVTLETEANISSPIQVNLMPQEGNL